MSNHILKNEDTTKCKVPPRQLIAKLGGTEHRIVSLSVTANNLSFISIAGTENTISDEV